MPFEHRCLEITYEKINKPGSFKEKSYTLVGSQYSIFQKGDTKFEQTLGLSDYIDIKEKKGITIVQLKLHLIY